ncbi:MAG: CHAT domain-containing protein [Thermoanaerobaculia bacterium]
MLDVGSRNLLAGETAATALELGFPRIAFQYHSAFLDALHEEQQTAPADDATQRQMRLNRAIALRGRAAIRLHLGQGAEALRELQEASGIAVQTPVDQKIEKALRARIAEVRGEAALRSKNPRLAISEFTAALDLASSVTYRTFEAILLARRAEAHRMAGNVAGAREDLEAAIERVNAEEADLLAGHWRGQGEGLWRDYFSRFQESYGRLITLLSVDDRRRAFAYAEKARAFEPLKLVLELPVGAEVVRSLDTKSVTPKALEAIQAALPLGTFVFEYQVTAEQTFVWVLSHDDFDMRTLPVGKAKIENWLRTLQHDGASQSRQRFERSLDGPFEALLRVPLALMTGMKNGKLPSRRLVIVPDRFTHGLPFAALHDAVAGDYLVERFPLTVAPSATLYIYALDRDAKLADAGGTPSALLVGDPAFNDQLELAHGMERLGAARAEAAELEALYAPNSKSLVDLQATVPAFLEQSQHRTIVHVAGHALVNRRAPFGTFLLMAPAKGHNGLLYTDELLTRLQLDQARLVVLAACSSAGGVPVGPEGLAPLVRPFIAAGVPGVVGSLWTINDQRSKKVLVEFLHRYREGHDAASALRLAQIHFLRRRREGIPILAWAAFQNVGYASSPYARSAIANRGIQ